MKIKNIAKIILMITFFIILGNKVYATTGIIKDKTVKLRKEPNSKTVLDYVYKDDEVEILELENGWYKVKAKTELGKVTGYISEDEVNVEGNISNSSSQKDKESSNEEKEEIPAEKNETEETTPTEVEEKNTETVVSTNIQENNKYTIGQEISVKILPIINSKQKAKISGNIEVVEIINEWVKIENDIQSGWIRKNTLKQSLTKNEIPEQQQPEEQPEEKIPEETTTQVQEVPQEKQEPEIIETTVDLQKVGYVSAEGLRVRKEPTTDSEEIHSLSKNDKVEIIGQTGKWYKINLDGVIGYVSSKYISDTKVVETTSRSGSTLRNENITTNELAEPKEEKNNVEEKTKVEEAPVEKKEKHPATSRVTGTAIVEYAKQYLGYKYVSGGTSPSKGFDCSGFTQYVYKHFGISVNRTSGAQINNGVAVEKSNLQPGDLVLFNNDANTKIGHVGIYVGDGNFIHASNPSDGVKITTLTSGYYHKRYVGARRVY